MVDRLLENKTAIIYGGGGRIGVAVARTFAREGARVMVVGRTVDTLRAVCDDIHSSGGAAEYAVLDAFDEQAVDRHVDQVVAVTGAVDVTFNLITRGDAQGTPLIEMTTEDLLRAVTNGLRTNFITARAAARHMIRQGSGVILHLNSASGAGAHPGMGSTGPADAATEALMRYLAAETGRQGIRVCGIWVAGIEETFTQRSISKVIDEAAPTPETAVEMISRMSVLGRAPRLADVAELAAFLASDRAAGITGSMTNATAGLVLR